MGVAVKSLLATSLREGAAERDIATNLGLTLTIV
jgi:hypothetical protein